MDPLYILAIVIGCALLYYMYYRHHKLVTDGKVIERKSNFLEQEEEFSLSLEDPDEVSRRLQSLAYGEMKASMQVNGQAFLFSGPNWSARLLKKDNEGNKVVYSFQFLNWKTHNGGVMYEDHMNMLLTAVEKMFLSIDPATQVKTRMLETKTSHKFF